jgi:hypothetical protein
MFAVPTELRTEVLVRLNWIMCRQYPYQLKTAIQTVKYWACVEPLMDPAEEAPPHPPSNFFSPEDENMSSLVL